MTMNDGAAWRSGLIARVAVCLVLVGAAETTIDGTDLGAVIGGVAMLLAILTAVVRPALVRVRAARSATIAATLYALVLTEDPSLLGCALFWVAVSLAALLPRRGFDDAMAWATRLAWHGVTAALSPFRDAARIAILRDRRAPRSRGLRAAATMLVLPVVGGGVFVMLFASANPLIGDAVARIALPDITTVIWRSAVATVVGVATWSTLRPSAQATRFARSPDRIISTALDPRVATLIVSLVTFNAIFAVENTLDLVFLWSGAALPAGVTMADYAHRGAYSLIVTAVLAGLFVLVALRPGSAGAVGRPVRVLVALWLAQNLLLVASSALRTLDYVDAYGMTVLRLAALGWMTLVAVGLALIGWRLLRGRSARWLINANALAATLVLTVASVVDLGAVAAGWNVRVAVAQGKAGPPLDLCYLARLGPSALVSLARLERHAKFPAQRDRIAALRWRIEQDVTGSQGRWRGWTPRNARRLRAVDTLVGLRRPALIADPDGRRCDGSIVPPRAPSPPPPPLTRAP
ncbi:DUF4153 domain-containing protein [Sphingomonas oligophenolica]|nr:DUF4173 domain-containing protein [Sphingomonas oligophenolica]